MTSDNLRCFLIFSTLRFVPTIALAGLLGSPAIPASPSAPDTVRIRLSVDEDPIVPRLAESLGYLKQEGIEIVPVKVESFSKEDYLLQAPLIHGQIDASYHWFQHTIYGARHKQPITAVMLINDAPGITVMVANAAQAKIRSAADFAGKRIAQGAAYGTKSLLTSYLAHRAGLAPHSYTAVFTESQGRQAAVLTGLQAGSVDVLTFQEPITSVLQQSQLVTTLYDLTNAPSTIQILGAPWPAQSVLMSPAYIAAHPRSVQHLVNAFVRTLRFIKSHSVAQVVAALPADYFAGKDQAAEIALIEKSLPTYARDNYGFSLDSVQLVLNSIEAYDFDGSEEGRWRATSEVAHINPKLLYTNRFVNQAMRQMH